jgi:hypothetical protein
MHGKRRRRDTPLSARNLGAEPVGKSSGGMSTMGMILNPAAAMAEKMGAGPDTMIGKIFNPLSGIFGKK